MDELLVCILIISLIVYIQNDKRRKCQCDDNIEGNAYVYNKDTEIFYAMAGFLACCVIYFGFPRLYAAIYSRKPIYTPY